MRVNARLLVVLAAFGSLLACGTASAKVKLVPKLGLLASGSGEGSADCSGSGTLGEYCGKLEDEDMEDQSGWQIGGDMLFELSRSAYLGVTLLYSTRTEFEEDDGDDMELGTDLVIGPVFEYRIPVNPMLDVALRGHGGLTVLFPGADLEDSIDDAKQECREMKARISQASCARSAKGPSMVTPSAWARGWSTRSPQGSSCAGSCCTST